MLFALGGANTNRTNGANGAKETSDRRGAQVTESIIMCSEGPSVTGADPGRHYLHAEQRTRASCAHSLSGVR